MPRAGPGGAPRPTRCGAVTFFVGDSLLVTEPVTKTVPVTREEIRIERVPVDEDEGGEATERAEVSELEKK